MPIVTILLVMSACFCHSCIICMYRNYHMPDIIPATFLAIFASYDHSGVRHEWNMDSSKCMWVCVWILTEVLLEAYFAAGVGWDPKSSMAS